MSKKDNLKAIKRLQDREYDYACWIEENEGKRKIHLQHKPLISVVLFEQNATEMQKKRCLRSLKNQKYKSTERIFISEKIIKWDDIKKQIHGEYVMFISMCDFLASNAIAELVLVIDKDPEVCWVYSDEDTFRECDGKRINPKFKPNWSYDTFLSFFYTGNMAIYRADVCMKLENWESTYSKYWNYDFALRFLDVCDQKKIMHIPKVLYHASDNDNTKALYEEQVKILSNIKKEWIYRQKIDAVVEKEERAGQYRIVYKADGMVSIVIPSKDNVAMLLKAIESIEQYTSYDNYEIIVVDNGSNAENKIHLEENLFKKDIRYIYEPMDFNFSKMCNIGAKASKGEYILFLNDDVECVPGDWLERMVGQAAQPGVGAVGAKLLYPNENMIQHIGVINLKESPSHVLSKVLDIGVLADGRNCLDYNYEAVTAACLLVRKSVYESVNGFDENFPISYNDIDLCYRLRELGLRNVVRTDAVLIHHESVSRGLDAGDENKMIRLRNECARLYKAHSWIIENGDAFYSPNFTKTQTDFSLLKKEDNEEYNYRVCVKRCTNTEISVTIDKISKVDGIQISGWYWYQDDDFTNFSDVYIVFKNENDGKEYWYDTARRVRYDVAQALENQAIYCGFSCKVQKKETVLLQGCRIGLCVRRYNLKLNLMNWTDIIID